jgi:hypothetical protein
MPSDAPPSTPSPPSPLAPLFLFADSQLLFWKDGGGLFLDRVRAELGPSPPRAAYLGASNGDVPEYYDIFAAAMEGIGVHACRRILSAPTDADRAFLDEASVIVLAGGDAERGMQVFQESGLAERLVARYAAGAVLIGVSAGAVQLGLRVPRAAGGGMDGLRLAPLLVGAHEEPDWVSLGERVSRAEGTARGLGIPAGAGAILHPDLTVEPVRRGLVEIALVEGELTRALLLPGQAGEAGEQSRERQRPDEPKRGV